MNDLSVTPEEHLRHTALTHAKRGFRVFPLRRFGKTPAIEDWPNEATTDLARIEKWWSGEHTGCNIGIAGHENLLMLDFDTKDGKKGRDTYDFLKVFGIGQDTYTVETPTGGIHSYYNVPGGTDITISANAYDQYPDMDVRCDGGYVVAAGSQLENGVYKVIDDSDPAPIDESLLRELKTKSSRREKAEDNQTPLTKYDRPANIDRAKRYLENAPIAVQGDGGDHTTYKVIATVKDFGISQEACFDLVSVHWNEDEKAIPPWDPAELLEKIKNVYRYGQNAPGIRSPQADFGEAESGGLVFDADEIAAIEQQTQDRKARRQADAQYLLNDWWDASTQGETFEGKPLLEDVLERDNISVMYGPSNVGKSFVALDVAYSVATGLGWNGHASYHGNVVYFALEGGRGILKRIAAMNMIRQPRDKPKFYLIRDRADFFSNNDDLKKALATIADLGGAEFIVIDTLAMAMLGGNENDISDMSKVVDRIKILQESTGAHVMLVHHTGKDVSKGARGHSSLRAAIDTEIELTVGHEMYVKKQRDIDILQDPWRYKIDKVIINKETGANAGSLRWLNQTEFEPLDLPRESSELFHCLLDHFQGQRFGLKAAADWFHGRHDEVGKSARANLEWVSRQIKEVLVPYGYVEQVGRGHNSYCIKSEFLEG